MRPTSLALTPLALTLALSLAAGAHALSPGARERGFVEGANHHLGDASFVARFGRAPGPGDAEALRMHTHLVYVRDWLASRPATRPELAPRRALILSHLDDYIGKGITPRNRALPWRNPVFVDDLGNVCAVGALIEATAPDGGGRALVERIAARHRFAYLEDIDMPEVAAWIAGSGFTPLELASIQPGYEGPQVLHWQRWDRLEERPADGPWSQTNELGTTTGAWLGGQMHGHWERRDPAGRLLGSGDLVNGRGTWTSVYPSGGTLARGPFVASRPHGRWSFWHEGGALAARGSFHDGDRHGAWTFYQDAPGQVLLASGGFRGGEATGPWRHYDADGRLAATTRGGLAQWNYVWHAETPAIGGVRLRVDQGNFMGDYARVDRLTGRFGGKQVVVYRVPAWNEAKEALELTPRDPLGYELTRTPEGWVRSGCPWTPKARRHAERGEPHADGTRLDLDVDTEATCLVGAPVATELGAAYDALLGTPDDPRPWPPIVTTVVDHMMWFAEWPHVDPLFEAVYATLADRIPPGVL
ncbi:MAG: hypothetical protein IT385_05730 [Deltaproteobacteria bacterium]|nr:hypothetical protein [Deltaproteobacteria bacterium]